LPRPDPRKKNGIGTITPLGQQRHSGAGNPPTQKGKGGNFEVLNSFLTGLVTQGGWGESGRNLLATRKLLGGRGEGGEEKKGGRG